MNPTTALIRPPWRRLLCCSVVLLGLPAFAGAGEPKGPGDDPRTAIIERLRQLCVTEPELRGIFIDAAGTKAKDGKLLLNGFLDHAKQGELLVKKAMPLFKLKEWQKHYKNGIGTADMRVLPLRAEYLQRIKDDFLSFLSPDKKTPTLLAQTRLDDLYYDPASKKTIVVQGVCVAPNADKESLDGISEAVFHLLVKSYGIQDLGAFKVKASEVRLLNPLPVFQETFARKLNAPVLFTGMGYDPQGKLHLQGWMGKDVAADRLFREHFADHPAVAGPAQFSLQDMKKIDWPIQTRRWNERLLLDKEHRGTHIDSAYFQYSPKGELQLRVDALFDSPLEKEKYRELLADRLVPEVDRDVKAWPEVRKLIGSNVVVGSLENYGGLRDEIQSDAIRKLGQKQTLIEHVSFDPQGTLRIHGLLASEVDRQQLADHLAKKTGPGWAREHISLKEMRVEDWDAKVKLIQEKLASPAEVPLEKPAKDKDDGIGAGHPLLRKTRLDRVSFGYSDKGKLQIEFTGLTLHPDRKEVDENLGEHLMSESYRIWPSLKEREVIRHVYSVEEIQSLPLFVQALQDRLLARPELDGIYIKDASFDKDGKLALSGFWRGPEQEKELLAFLKATFKGTPPRVDDRGVSAKALETVATDKLLLGLRQYAADRLEEVRVDRVYFDKTGKLQIKVHATGESAEADRKRVKAKAEELIRALPGGKTIKLAGWRPPAPRAEMLVASTMLLTFAGPPEEEKTPPSLVQHLRKTVLSPEDPYWDGVLIRRAFFDIDGTYRLVGLVDNVKQRDALDKLLEELAKTPDFRSTLKNKWDLEGLEILPLRPMIAALYRALPEFPEFDYLRLDRAYHVYEVTDKGVKSRLEFVAYSPKSAKERAAELERAKATLHRLLREDPRWSARAGEGVELRIEPVTDRNAGRLALQKAHQLLIEHLPPSFSSLENGGQAAWGFIGCTPVLVLPARIRPAETPLPAPLPATVLRNAVKYLDVAILHDPEDSTAWFLRGAVYLAADDRFAASRDLRRMNRLEFADPGREDLRLAAIELFQGSLRQATADLAVDTRIDAARGRRTLRLVDAVRLRE